MTTKTRNVVIIVALLLVILALILSITLYAADEGKASPSGSLPVSHFAVPGGWKLSGKSLGQGLWRESLRCEST